MKLDGVDISFYNARELDNIIITPTPDNQTFWNAGSLTPIMFENTFSYNVITAPLLVQGFTRNQAYINYSNLIKKANKCTLFLEDRNLYFNVILEKVTTKISNNGKNIRLLLEFKGYGIGKEIINSFYNQSDFSIVNTGNSKTPCIVTITPNINMVDLTIWGLSQDPIIIKNLNSVVTIDGESGLVTEDGRNKFMDTDMWEFTSLQPGSNNIKISNNNCNIEIKYKPRWI